MKNILFLFAIGLNLGACKKADEIYVAPQAIEAGFDQEFSLRYQQRARLPAASPELTVAVTDLVYTFCPKNANCIIADFVFPTLSITDAAGQTQQLKLPVPLHQAKANPAWIDSASVRANGRRYVLYYTRYERPANIDQPGKQDLAVVLRVARPN